MQTKWFDEELNLKFNPCPAGGGGGGCVWTPPSGFSRIAKKPPSGFGCINPRPAGPLDFPPPAGGAFERPPPWSRLLVVVEKNKGQRSKAREKSFRNQFGHFFGSVQNWGHQGSKFQNFPNRFFDNKIFNFKGRATKLIPSCFSR